MLILSCIFSLTTVFTSDALADGFFFIERPKLGLGTFYEFEEEIRTLPETETKNISHDLLEKVTIGTNGWIYHPNLLEYHLLFEPEWRQESFRQSYSSGGSTQTRKRDTSVLAYDGSTTLFKQKPFSLDIFGNRNTRQLDLSYTQDTDIESETYGTRLNFSNTMLPVSIEFMNRQLTQTGFYRSDEDHNEVQVKIRHNVKKSSTELNILYDDTDRTTWAASESSRIASTITNGEFTNTYFFTGDERLKLASLFYLSHEEYDNIKMDAWILTENFYWTHSKKLLTQYMFHFNQREVNGFETDEKELQAFLIHHLDNTLTTKLSAGAVFNDFAGGGEDRYRSNIGFIYRQPISWGSIELGAAYDYVVTKRSGNQNIIPTEANFVLSTGTETFMDRENVVIESIVVADMANAIVYTENVDYRIEEVGSKVRISRSLLGAITDGQRISVHYNYRFDAGYDDSIFEQDYRCSLALWSFLYLTYTHGRITQDILSGEPSNNALGDTYHTVHIQLDTKWAETQFLYDKQDRTNGNASITRSVRQLINLNLSRNCYLSFSGDIGDRNFPDINKEESFYSIGTSIGWTPKWWCSFSLIFLRNNISGDQQDMLYNEISPNVKLMYGVWSGTVTYRLKDQEDNQTGDSLWRQEVFVTINRRLW